FLRLLGALCFLLLTLGLALLFALGFLLFGFLGLGLGLLGALALFTLTLGGLLGLAQGGCLFLGQLLALGLFVLVHVLTPGMFERMAYWPVRGLSLN
ncbi:hypothetical protein, partial [Staphylococcus aureus]